MCIRDRTYVVADACGNTTAGIVHTISVDDTTDPVIAAPNDISIEACKADDTSVTAGNAGFAYSEAEVTLTSGDVTTFLDLAGASITEDCAYTVTYSDSQDDTCPVLVTRTYVIVDACGNSTNDIQTITVDDTTDPVIAAPADISISACTADATTVTAVNAGFAYSETSVTLESADVITFLDLAGASITEACDYTVTYIDIQTAAEMCGILVTRAYTITDACGNDSSDNQIITVEDTTDPTLDDPSGLPSSFSQDLASTECNFNYFVEIPDASDNCDDDLSVTLTATDVNNNVLTVQLINNDGTAAVTLPLGVNTLTLTLVDDCMNDVTHSWTVTLIDNIAPQISCP